MRLESEGQREEKTLAGDSGLVKADYLGATDAARLLAECSAFFWGPMPLPPPEGVSPFPVNCGGWEAGVFEDVLNLWDRPDAPVVDEGVLPHGATLEVEVDATSGAVVDGVDGGLVPDVGVSLAAAAFGEGFEGLPSAEDVEEENAVGLGVRTDLK